MNKLALEQLRAFLLSANMDKLLDAYRQRPRARNSWLRTCESIPEPLRILSNLFCLQETVPIPLVERYLPAESIAALVKLRLLKSFEGVIAAGEYELVHHLDLFLFCQIASPYTRFYYGDDSAALSRLLFPAKGRVLDLCAGVGAQALACAQTAEHVTAVEIEPLARELFWINAELNGLSANVEFLIGDLYGPVAGRQFDLVCSNPPFIPVPPDLVLPLFAGGGPDGLAIVRRILAGLPEKLAPDGRCHIIGSVAGDGQRPHLSSLESLAVEAGLKIEVSCPSRDELAGGYIVANLAATALTDDGITDADRSFRAHFASLGATYLYYYLLTATHSQRPALIVHTLPNA